MAKKYTRTTRSKEFFHQNAKPLKKHLRSFYFDVPGHELKSIADIGPGATHKLLGKIALSGLVITNEFLLYRLLKDLFELPDYITCYSREIRPTHFSILPHPNEWAFLFSGPPSAPSVFIEVQRCSFDSVPQLLVWVPRLRIADSSIGEQAGSFLKQFIADLDNHLLRNKNLFDERVEKKIATGRGIVNVFGEMLVAGDHLLERGRRLDVAPSKKSLAFGEKSPIPPKGTFYLAASCFFLMALEGFANLLLELLLKPEYRSESDDDRSPFLRATFRADLDLRLLSLPLYCDGFIQQRLTPQSPGYKKLLALRKFRNSIFHNNVTEFHEILIFTEDHLHFFFDPSTDRHSPVPESLRTELPVRRGLITEEAAKRVRYAVEEIVDEVIEGMQPAYRDWVRAWGGKHVIPVFRDSEGRMKVDVSLQIP